ncbi:hypothetical protein EC957_010946 [Mortierella hygrophila]|uniref:Phosphatidate phosphatase APP1 catalytic domain-containing protein n=1 Tax=Mortierella hygrophila TaxID=979708 RepID=A0A9P6FA36_9FUNG|nr:hypothetical protein EC957_010946 [Mortierella hygrophila]
MHSIDRKPIGEQQPLSSQQAPPLPQRPNEQYQGSDMTNPDTASVKSKESVDTAADVEQHCLLFPTYATRHSRSGSKDPLDWNIRVRGWAYSKRSNRRKRLVMSMARKLAGVTKDNKVYDTLESRFGMFLASNTQGARFSIQCVGATSTSQMELAGDPSSHDPTVDELMSETHTSEGALAIAQTAKDKLLLRKSLEENREQEYLGKSQEGSLASSPFQPQPQLQQQQQQYPASAIGSPYLPADGSLLTRVTSPESQESSFSDRWTKGAAFVKGAYKKYKPIVVAQVQSSLPGTEQEHTRSLIVPGESNDNRPSSRSSSHQGSTISDCSGDEARADLPSRASRTDSGDTILSQTETHIEDLGHGMFPTVQISSQPGGHFDGTLRVSHEDVQAHRKQSSLNELSRSKTVTGKGDESHPRFLKLHAYHPDMKEPCHGIVNLVDPEGISIISDIDDTIKETDIVAGARIILRNTFLNDMVDVPGMAKVYKNWWKQGAAIHYVSNSPWQLIPSLLEFFHNHKFPPGSAHLRLHDSVLKTYFMTPGQNKRKSIREILLDFPGRKFILVGDSGEIDMEIYTDMAVEFPEQVFRIFIRDITSAKLKEESDKMSAAPPARALSFTSMIQKAPITAVTTGFGYFSRSGAGAGGEEGAYAAATAGGISGDGMSVENSASAQSQKANGAGQQPPPKPRRANVAASNGSSPQSTPAPTSPGSQSPMVPGDLDGDTMPGQPPAEPQVTKTPYEIWQDRVNHCQSQLLGGTMTLFDDASALEEDPIVRDMLRHYENHHSLDLEEDNLDNDLM